MASLIKKFVLLFYGNGRVIDIGLFFGGISNQDMSLIEMCFCSRLYGIFLGSWYCFLHLWKTVEVSTRDSIKAPSIAYLLQ